MWTIKILGQDRACFGLVRGGRGLVLKDHILLMAAVCTRDGDTSVKWPETLPVEIRAKDFTPWLRQELTCEEMRSLKDRFPIHVKNVLREYDDREDAARAMTTEDYLVKYGNSEFSECDLVDAQQIVKRLQKPRNEADKWIRRHLSAEARKIIGGYSGRTDHKKAIRSILARALSGIANSDLDGWPKVMQLPKGLHDAIEQLPPERRQSTLNRERIAAAYPQALLSARARRDSWVTEESKVISELRRLYQGGFDLDGEHYEYTEDRFVKEHADRFREEKWCARINDITAEESERECLLLNLALQVHRHGDGTANEHQRRCTLIASIGLEVVYADSSVYLNKLFEVPHDDTSLRLLNHYQQPLPGSELSSASGQLPKSTPERLAVWFESTRQPGVKIAYAEGQKFLLKWGGVARLAGLTPNSTLFKKMMEGETQWFLHRATEQNPKKCVDQQAYYDCRTFGFLTDSGHQPG